MAYNKYGNRKTVTSDGVIHDSKKEADRWMHLKLLERAGLISDLKRQVKFELIPAQYEIRPRYGKYGRRLKDEEHMIEHECSYIADFVYYDNETKARVVEDVKGKRTPEYVIKRKMMLWLKGIKINEI